MKTIADIFDEHRKFLDKGFCPTGPGGGIDNSCGRGGGSGGKLNAPDRTRAGVAAVLPGSAPVVKDGEVRVHADEAYIRKGFKEFGGVETESMKFEMSNGSSRDRDPGDPSKVTYEFSPGGQGYMTAKSYSFYEDDDE